MNETKESIVLDIMPLTVAVVAMAEARIVQKALEKAVAWIRHHDIPLDIHLTLLFFCWW